MTRKIDRQTRRINKFNWQVKRLTATTRMTTGQFKKLKYQLLKLTLGFNGKEPSWPQFNHEKEKPRRSTMHRAYAHKKGRGR